MTSIKKMFVQREMEFIVLFYRWLQELELDEEITINKASFDMKFGAHSWIEMLKSKNKLVDDMFDTLGTVVAAAEELVTHGATGIIAIGTHGIFSGPAMMRLNKSDAIKKVIVTNSLPQENNLKQTNKLEVVDVGDLFTEVIRRILTGASISAMFSHE